uniref:7-dehydrocholesterol reductase n=1 Tax=Panagrolaimus sp. JU765 TaxID=591449 RepID=A0AC34PYB7_9BILA
MSLRYRRSSSYSTLSLGRRSSINSKDVEKIQQLLAKRSKIPPQIAFSAVILSPIAIFILASISRLHFGSFFAFVDSDYQLEIPNLLNSSSWTIFSIVFLIQIIFICILPSDDYKIRTENGEKQIINANSFVSCLLICLFYILGSQLGLFKGTIFFENFIEICSIFSIFIVFLIFYIQLFIFEDDSSEQFILDFFFGKILQPKVFEVDIKNLVTNRLMLTFWALYSISAVYHNKNLFGKLNDSLLTLVALNLIYVARRQWTEYLPYVNLDGQNDRAGFYRLWGVGVGLLLIHTTPISVLASAKSGFNHQICIGIAAVNLVLQYLNTSIDLQKYNFRAAKGKLKINDKDPFFIAAKFKTESNDSGVSLLLGSGYFSTCRHLNYTTEFLTFLTWSFLLNSDNVLAYASPLLLCLLLYGRMTKDEVRCLAKYNQYWLQYCNKVQYLVIPGIL